ncbi:hypothetical protein PFTANZ_06199, partial [Plasmodium falciparum Tanzania (2000708)]
NKSDDNNKSDGSNKSNKNYNRSNKCNSSCNKNNRNYFIKAMQHDIMKSILYEYYPMFNNYFSLAIIIKRIHDKINIKNILEKIMPFLSCNKVKKNYNKLTKENIQHNTNDDYMNYHTSLVMICLNKAFYLSYLCMYQKLIEKTFIQNFVYLLLKMNNACNYNKDLAKYTIINIYYYIKQINKFKNIKQDTQKNLCFNYNIYDNLHINEKEKYKNRLSQNQPFYIINNIQQHQIINIINYHHDVLSSYMYKKIINIDSIKNVTKILKLTQFLVMYNYYTYLYQDVCLNIIKYTKKTHFSYLSKEIKNQLYFLILQMFNYILYLYYKYVNHNRIYICEKNQYFEQIKESILKGSIYVNLHHLSKKIKNQEQRDSSRYTNDEVVKNMNNDNTNKR